jgi:hypothetical protein
MKVTQVSATIRFSKDTGQGAWKVIELGAEASVDPEENWALAQQGLYAMLTTQLRALWGHPSTGSGESGPEHTQNGHEKPPSTTLRTGVEPTWEEIKAYPSPPYR